MYVVDINECESNPCEHGGTCTDMQDGYSCACESGFTGSECETGTLILCLLCDGNGLSAKKSAQCHTF